VESYCPGPHIDGRECGHLTGFQVVNYFARNLDSLLIGKFLGAQALGYYSLAYKLMMFPLQNFTWVVTKVMFPAFSKIQDDLVRVRRNYLKMVKAVALFSFPFMAVLWGMTPEVIRIFYGPQWDAVIPLVRIFCFCGMVQSISSLGGVIYLSRNRTDVQFMMSLIGTSLLGIVLWGAIPYGIEHVAFCYTVFYLLWTHVSVWAVCRLIGVELTKVYKAAAVPLLMSLGLMVLTFYGSRSFHAQPLMKMVILGGASAVVYGVSVVLTRQARWENRQIVLNEV
jgi:O-antigen/teichoic acid export membrane protein